MPWSGQLNAAHVRTAGRKSRPARDSMLVDSVFACDEHPTRVSALP
jgi:hypothetical protein